MKKVIFGIFAHPDDEAFGPCGTLLMEVKSGADIHLITLTLGEAGSNPDSLPNLAKVREKEWRTAGALIGAKSMRCLGYRDGHLDNLAMLEIHSRLTEIITTTASELPSDATIELMSMDTNGISGHIDHIVASRSACYVFYTLKTQDPRVSHLRLACASRAQSPEPNTDWLFAEAGRAGHEIDETVDARAYQNEIIAIMRAHQSQRGDSELHIKQRGESLGLDHFIVHT